MNKTFRCAWCGEYSSSTKFQKHRLTCSYRDGSKLEEFVNTKSMPTIEHGLKDHEIRELISEIRDLFQIDPRFFAISQKIESFLTKNNLRLDHKGE